MKLVNNELFINTDLDISRPLIIVVEAPKLYSNIIYSLYLQIGGEERGFFLSDDNKELQLNKVGEIVLNPLSIDINDKKIISRLHSMLVNNSGDFFEEKEIINSEMICLIEKLINTISFDHIDYAFELDWATILKMYSVKIEERFDNISEKIIEYIRVSSILLNIKVIFFVNLKCFIEEDDLKSIYEIARYLNVFIILIEGHVPDMRLNSEQYYIIDSDLCVINT